MSAIVHMGSAFWADVFSCYATDIAQTVAAESMYAWQGNDWSVDDVQTDGAYHVGEVLPAICRSLVEGKILFSCCSLGFG